MATLSGGGKAVGPPSLWGAMQWGPPLCVGQRSGALLSVGGNVAAAPFFVFGKATAPLSVVVAATLSVAVVSPLSVMGKVVEDHICGCPPL